MLSIDYQQVEKKLTQNNKANLHFLVTALSSLTNSWKGTKPDSTNAVKKLIGTNPVDHSGLRLLKNFNNHDKFISC